jgi:hypothetical protein
MFDDASVDVYEKTSVGFYDESLNGSSRIKRISRNGVETPKLQLNGNCYYHRDTEDTENCTRLEVTRTRPFPKISRRLRLFLKLRLLWNVPRIPRPSSQCCKVAQCKDPTGVPFSTIR